MHMEVVSSVVMGHPRHKHFPACLEVFPQDPRAVRALTASPLGRKGRAAHRHVTSL